MTSVFPILLTVLSLFVTAAVCAQPPTSSNPIVIGHAPPGHKAKFLPQPEYPKSATFVGIEGEVSVLVTVDEIGKVIEAEIASGHPFFHTNSIKAARDARFEPFFLSGKAVRFRTTIVYNFTRVSAHDSQKLGIINGRAIKLPEPKYPKEAEEFCADGEVRVHVKVDKTGEVLSATSVAGNELLQSAAIESARKAHFTPTPYPQIETEGILVYNFKPVSGCIQVTQVNSKARILPKPQIASVFRQGRLQLKATETIEVQVIINLDGEVTHARAISGNPLLRPACVMAARKAKFFPTLINTIKPIRVRGTIIYKIKPDGTVEI